MAAAATTPSPHWSRFEQEQDLAVRALIQRVTGLNEQTREERGHFQAALSFAWSNFRSVRRGGGGARLVLVRRRCESFQHRPPILSSRCERPSPSGVGGAGTLPSMPTVLGPQQRLGGGGQIDATAKRRGFFLVMINIAFLPESTLPPAPPPNLL